MTVETSQNKDALQSLACACGGGAMKQVRVVPRLGAFPELRSYRCGHCGAVETVEITPPAALVG